MALIATMSLVVLLIVVGEGAVRTFFSVYWARYSAPALAAPATERLTTSLSPLSEKDFSYLPLRPGGVS